MTNSRANPSRYLVDITEVPDFNTMYELYDPSTVMFFYRNKHIMIDLGTGNNNKINWPMSDKQEFIDIVEVQSHIHPSVRPSIHPSIYPFPSRFLPLPPSPSHICPAIHTVPGIRGSTFLKVSHKSLSLFRIRASDRLPRCAQGTWSGRFAQGLLDKVQVLRWFGFFFAGFKDGVVTGRGERAV